MKTPHPNLLPLEGRRDMAPRPFGERIEVRGIKKGLCIMYKLLIILLLAIYVAPLHAETPSGNEILERIDHNYAVKTRISTATMIVKGRRGTRTIRSKTWGEGTEKAFTKYLSPPREKDTKMLKLGDELWIWSPSADRTIKIAGHMLRQSLMGSDVSYEDFMEDPKLSNMYNAELIGEENEHSRDFSSLELRPCQRRNQ